MLEERRRHPRLVVPLEAEYQLEGSEWPRLGTIQNLSAGGAAFITEDDLSVGTEIPSFKFTLPGRDQEPVKTKAVVVRSETHRGVGRESERLLGVTFVYADDETFKRVQRFIFNRLTTGDRAGAHVPVEKRRIPFRKPIVFSYEKYEEFVEAVSDNLSMNGLFIRTEEPRRPGTQLSFEFRLGKDMPLIQGQGEVAWRRHEGDSPERPPGMGIRFLRLDVRSRELIRRLVKEYTVSKVLTAEGEQQSRPTPGSGDTTFAGVSWSAVTRGTSSGSLGRLVATTAATVVIGVLSLFTVLRIAVGRPPELPAGLEARIAAWRASAPKAEPGLETEPDVQLVAATSPSEVEAAPSEVEPPVEAAPEVVTETAEATLIADTVATAEPTSLPEAPTPVAPETTAQTEPKAPTPEPGGVEQVVEAWAAAWSAQRVDDYLGFYAPDFEPPSDMNRPEWEAQRRSRLSGPDWIKVTLGGITQRNLATDRVSVSFPQTYESNTYSDNVTKTLDLVWDGDSWKIVSETSTG